MSDSDSISKSADGQKAKSPQFSLVMPLFNEGSHIYENLKRTSETVRMLGPLGDCEIIVANDGSLDNSRAEVDRAEADIPGVRALHLTHGGKGEALRQGARLATGEFVIFFDSDLDIPPEQILFFIAVQRAKKADAVIGSKMHPDSTVHYPVIRRIYSVGYFALTKIMFGLPIRDTQTGLKLVRRNLLLRALDQTQVKGFAFDLELLVRLVQLKAVMVEAPVVVEYKWKFGGIGVGTIWGILTDTVATWRRTRTGTK
ncbi:MAG: glycosyltransferase family 2 protein [Candidatus Methylacidiphilales bacterium]|nr:glycosyltransferase family 2 protein [Candidatus Methylacidiphilales bacterium]